MALPADLFALSGTVLDGKYRIDHVVAEGGFGVVYAAHHLALDVPLALKVLKPSRHHTGELRADVVSGFLAEARTTARLSHPNIARALDTGVMPSVVYPEGLPWIALEWLEGRTLEDELRPRRGGGGRSPRQALQLLSPVLDAMDHAHRLGISHRDLKPSNVMLIEERGRTVPKVLDFGIAKITEAPMPPSSGQTATRSALITFSPGYAAPEQVAMTRTGPWTDVHALALLLIEVLCDRQVYGWSDSRPILVEILASERPTPGRLGVDVGPWEGVLQRALAINPAERQARAGLLLDELSASVDAAEQHWQFKSLGSPNTTAPLQASQPPVGVTTGPKAASTTASAAVSAQSVVPSGGGRRLLLVGLGAGLVLAVAIAALRRPAEPLPSSREPVGPVRPPEEAPLPPRSAAAPTAPLSASAAPAEPSASPQLAPSASAVRLRPVAPAVSAHPKPAPARLAPTDNFE
ncbi:MAG TPA: serine/threonine-protein kinase [Polyangiaceae bacterium]|nr:serine/threonine-protein kinase [Polyangiaceae bacterium]